MDEPIMLYPNGVKGMNKLPTEDLRTFAKFNRVVKNSLMMDRLIAEKQQEDQK